MRTNASGSALTFAFSVATAYHLGDGTINVYRNGSPWATDADATALTGDGTRSLTFEFGNATPLNHGDAIRVTTANSPAMFTFVGGGAVVPLVTQFPATNIIPSVPTLVSVIGGVSTLTLNVTGGDSPTSYRVFEDGVDKGTFTVPIVVTPADGSKRSYAVAGINAVGESHKSNAIVWSTLPPAPTGLMATATAPNGISVAYTPTASDHALSNTSWEYGTTNPPTTSHSIGSTTSPCTFPDPIGTIQQNTTYYFRARGMDDLFQQSPYSEIVSTTTPPAIPGAPNLTLIDTGNPNLTFHFNYFGSGGGLATSSTLYRNGVSVGAITDGGQYTPPDADVATYTITGTNVTGEGNQSAGVQGQIVLAAPTPTLTALSQTQFQLDFDAPATGTVEALFDGSATPVTSIGTVTDNQLLSGIPVGATRYIRLRAVNSLGQSAGYGAPASGTTDSAIVVTCPPLTDSAGTVSFAPCSVTGGTGTYSGTCTIYPGGGGNPLSPTMSGGSPQAGPSSDWTYVGNGVFTYQFDVTDSHGNTGTNTGSVTVSGV
ncbi:MAG: hypothetical protein K8T89_15740 [Planctomycetes bacterium]|nr:hypothetical protein [Planctomycetota bacterium]